MMYNRRLARRDEKAANMSNSNVKTMRSYVCINHAGKVYKVVWFNEDRKGVYVGWYGTIKRDHFSYHTDGTKHFKHQALSIPQNQHKGTPINDIEDFQHVLFQLIPLSTTNIQIAGFEYQKEDISSSSATFLSESLFLDKTLAIDVYLV